MIAAGLSEIFGFKWLENECSASMMSLKSEAAEFYTDCYEEIRKKIAKGSLVHVDETEIKMRGTSGYVWVFTNLEEVLYVFKE